MSEKAPRTPEVTRNHEVENAPKSPEHYKKHESAAEKSNGDKHEDLSALRKEVAEHATSSKESKAHAPAHKAAPVSTGLVNKELKDMMFGRTISRIQKQLPPSQRVLSKVVHNKAVDAASRAGERTIARPIGILGGGLCALAGSIFSTYLSKHFGMRYNLLIFGLLFVAGYITATTLEIFVKFVARPKNQ